VSSVPIEHQAPCGVLATPETEVRGRACNHPLHRRREGERQKVVYGSWATEECTMCGSWRTKRSEPGVINPLPVPGVWRPASEPRERIGCEGLDDDE
jgi:hypothetical protein